MNTRRYTVTHEVQEGVSLKEAGGPLSSVVNCAKHIRNPLHHSKFIAAENFSADKIAALPIGFPLTKDVLAKYISLFIPLTVRIHGHVISNDRPDTWHGNTAPYLFSEYKGKAIDTVGSGWVQDVHYSPYDCMCTSCRSAGIRKQGFWDIRVLTARHVIHDDIESRRCEVVLFDDRDDGKGQVTLSGWEFYKADTEKDFCEIRYLCHDEGLGNSLAGIVEHSRKAGQIISKLFDENYKGDGVVVLVGHPHGCKKYVSIGKDKTKEGNTVIFDTASCGGCSGGVVIDIKQKTISSGWHKDWGSYIGGSLRHTHSGALNDVTGISANWAMWL